MPKSSQAITQIFIDDNEFFGLKSLHRHFVEPTFPAVDFTMFLLLTLLSEDISRWGITVHLLDIGDGSSYAVASEGLFCKALGVLTQARDFRPQAELNTPLDDDVWDAICEIAAVESEVAEATAFHEVVSISAYTDEMWRRCLNYFGHKCAYCGADEGLLRGFTFVREHFIPVSNPDCPGATPDNIVVACHSCNSQKNAHDAETWLTEHYGERKANRIIAKIERYFDSVRTAEREAAGAAK